MAIHELETKLSAEISEFRGDHRAEHIGPRYSGWGHFWFTTTMSILIVVVCAVNLENVTALEWMTVPIAFVYANLTEYFGHKGPMHKPKKGLREIYKRHALQHHRFFTHEAMTYDTPRDFAVVLFPPLLIFFFFGFFSLPVALVLFYFAGPNVAFLFMLTGFAYFLNYEWLHFAYHLDIRSWVYRIPGMLTLRQLHLNHHRPDAMSHYNFNITYPIGDWLFGTLYKPGNR